MCSVKYEIVPVSEASGAKAYGGHKNIIPTIYNLTLFRWI
jgi:hypothetical protein